MDLREDEARVGVHGKVEHGEDAKEFGEDVGTLVEVVAVDVGVDLFDVAEVGATLQNRHQLRLKNLSMKYHVVLFLFLYFSYGRNFSLIFVLLNLYYLNYNVKNKLQ